MPRERRTCANCIHARAHGSAWNGTFRAWCELGYWRNWWDRKPFFYRTLKAVVWKRNRKLRVIAQNCAFYNQPIPFDLEVEIQEKPR